MAKTKKPKTSMGYLTALKLSFKNLLTKKLRTILTAVAGSVGIIGVALILAASNGMTIYVNDLQRNMLAGMPIEISRISTMFNADREFDTPPGMVRPSQPFMVPHFNNFSQDFLDTVIDPIIDMGNHVSFNYDTQLNILHQFQPSSGGASQYTMLGTWMDASRNPSAWGWYNVNPFELPHEVYVQSLLETLAEAPQQTRDDMALVNAIPMTLILNTNSIANRNIIYLLFGQGNQDVYFADILGQQFRLVPNHEAIELVAGDFDWVRDGDTLWNYTGSRVMYIDRIMRQQPGTFSLTLGTGLAFPNGLPRYIVRDNTQNVMTETFANTLRTQIQTALTTPAMIDWVGIMSELADETLTTTPAIDDFIARISAINTTLGDVHRGGLGFLNDIDFGELNLDGSAEMALEMFMLHMMASALGLDLATVPALAPAAVMGIIPSMMSGISIYPTSFDNSEAIKRMIADWNRDNPHNQIHFLDIMGMLVDILNEMIMAVTIVMIVVSSISLVVSTLMIGIITYVSVLERTKEIGILRAIGARKKDIRRVFGAETLIIGFTAGVIGILMTLILILPINWALYNFNVVDVTNLARLPIWGALGLIALSCALTMMSGFFPSRIAAKRDPVVALRTD